MRALSLWQPWASLYCSPMKVNETRKFSTNVRGWVAIHAAKREVATTAKVYDLTVKEFGTATLPLGAIVGAVCISSTRVIGQAKPEDSADEILGDWTPGRWAWRRGEYLLLDEPVPWRGQQGFFKVPEDLFFDRIEQLRGPRTHVLHHGLPLCNFSIERTPREWPDGHAWVELSDHEAADCLDCLDIVRNTKG